MILSICNICKCTEKKKKTKKENYYDNCMYAYHHVRHFFITCLSEVLFLFTVVQWQYSRRSLNIGIIIFIFLIESTLRDTFAYITLFKVFTLVPIATYLTYVVLVFFSFFYVLRQWKSCHTDNILSTLQLLPTERLRIFVFQ